MAYARSRVLSLQTMDRGRRAARLLDHDRSGADAEISRRICRTPGNDCARPPSRLAISGSTPRTTRSCSRATSCYFFVRPKKKFLEVCVFLGRALKAPQVRRVDRASKSKVVHFFHIRHRDEVEAPITDWLTGSIRAVRHREDHGRSETERNRSRNPSRDREKQERSATPPTPAGLALAGQARLAHRTAFARFAAP